MRIWLFLLIALLVFSSCQTTTSCTYDSECSSWAYREGIETEDCPGAWQCVQESCQYSCVT